MAYRSDVELDYPLARFRNAGHVRVVNALNCHRHRATWCIEFDAPALNVLFVGDGVTRYRDPTPMHAVGRGGHERDQCEQRERSRCDSSSTANLAHAASLVVVVARYGPPNTAEPFVGQPDTSDLATRSATSYTCWPSLDQIPLSFQSRIMTPVVATSIHPPNAMPSSFLGHLARVYAFPSPRRSRSSRPSADSRYCSFRRWGSCRERYASYGAIDTFAISIDEIKSRLRV